jgi:oligoribonuclease NrnB/cAMP/cGMP phosphodiesterase (DHH superfamily)
MEAASYRGATVVFVDIAPPPRALRPLGEAAEKLIVLDHHVSARDRIQSDPELVPALERGGHVIHFDLQHSGAAMAWEHFHPDEALPELLRYVEDQDLWRWKLPATREVNAAISLSDHSFAVWEELAATSVDELASVGAPIVRANRILVERALDEAHSISLGQHRVEAVNASAQRSHIGHELASRALFGVPCGAVYRVAGQRVDVSVYSVGDFDVSALAGDFGGGGHRNAAGFSVSLSDWLERFV